MVVLERKETSGFHLRAGYHFVFFVVLLLFAEQSVRASDGLGQQFRTWEDESGKYQVEAKFKSYERGQVALLKANGEERKIDYRRLSEKDRKYVRDVVNQSKPKTPPPAKTTEPADASRPDADRAEAREANVAELKPNQRYGIDLYGTPQEVLKSNPDQPLIWFRILGDIDGFM